MWGGKHKGFFLEGKNGYRWSRGRVAEEKNLSLRKFRIAYIYFEHSSWDKVTAKILSKGVGSKQIDSMEGRGYYLLHWTPWHHQICWFIRGQRGNPHIGGIFWWRESQNNDQKCVIRQAVWYSDFVPAFPHSKSGSYWEDHAKWVKSGKIFLDLN